MPYHLDSRLIVLACREGDFAPSHIIVMVIAALGYETYSLSCKGWQGCEEFAGCRSRGDDKVLRSGGDGQRLHVDIGRAFGVLGGELEDGKLRFGLRGDCQTGVGGMNSTCAHADVEVGIQRAVLSA